jgi:chromosome segregation ATPase
MKYLLGSIFISDDGESAKKVIQYKDEKGKTYTCINLQGDSYSNSGALKGGA